MSDNAPNENDKAEEVSIEKAFELLHNGKKKEKDGEHWKAANLFVMARGMLIQLAQEQSKDTKEQEQIAELYLQQAREYLLRSRKCLLTAMTNETEQDEKSRKENQQGPMFLDLSDDDAHDRNKSFYSLFSKAPTKQIIIQDVSAPNKEQKEEEEEEEAVDKNPDNDNNKSLEQRLMELNASLPSRLKSEEERMSDLNRGLNRLGLSLYDQKEPFARFKDELPKSEEDQVADIISQAQDEVAIDRHMQSELGRTVGESNTKRDNKADIDYDDDNDDDDDDDDDEAGESDLDLSDEQLAMKIVHKKVVKTQELLAELIALLYQAKEAHDKEEEEQGIKDKDDDDDDSSLEGVGGSKAYLTLAKKKLLKSQKSLKNAWQEWPTDM